MFSSYHTHRGAHMTQTPFRLLVVDDEDNTRRSLADILRLEGYQVETANGGEAAIQIMSAQDFDLILLDLKMPGLDGLDVLRYVARSKPALSTPLPLQLPPTVIMLTAHGSLESAIEALRHGAHDYLLKPSSPEQILNSVSQGLQARADQIQKNSRMIQLEQEQGHPEDSTLGTSPQSHSALYHLPEGITYHPARREIKYQKEIIQLTPTEGKLIKVFLDHPGRVFNHRELVLLVQGYDTKEWEAPEVLRPLVSRLRRKLNHLPGGATWIISVRGTGYVFELGTSIDIS
jgi:DNA-binding response OmpR family regulator